ADSGPKQSLLVVSILTVVICIAAYLQYLKRPASYASAAARVSLSVLLLACVLLAAGERAVIAANTQSSPSQSSTVPQAPPIPTLRIVDMPPAPPLRGAVSTPVFRQLPNGFDVDPNTSGWGIALARIAGELAAIDLTSGRVLWRRGLDSNGIPAGVAGGAAFAGGASYTAYNRATGKPFWRSS